MAGVTLGYLRYVLGFDTLSFRKGATEAEIRMQRMERTFKKSFGAINAGFAGFAAAFSVGILTAGIKKALDYAGSLGEVSQQLGVTTKDLQVLRYAAGQVGVSQEQLETGLSKLTITMGKVAAGAKAPTEALKAIGIEADAIKNKDTGEVFRLIADGLAKIPDRAQRAAVEVALFGKSGAQLDNLLAGGRRAIDELAAAAERLGIVLSDDQIQRADDTADKLEAVKTVLAAQIAGTVADNADSIVSLAQSLAQLTGEIVRFLNSNPQLALGIIGGLAGGRIGGLPGAGIGAAGGVILGDKMARNRDDANMDPAFRKQQAINARRELDARRAAASDSGSIIRVRRTHHSRSGATIESAEAEYRRQIQLLVQARRAAARPQAQGGGGGATIPQFLAGGGGGGGRGRKDRSAEEAERLRREQLRDAHQFAQDERRGQMDILRARQDLAVNVEDQSRLALEMVDLGHQGALAEIAFQQSMGEIDEAQAKILIAQEDKLAALQRDAIAADALAQKTEDEDRMAETRFGIKRAELQAMLNLAQNSEERRRLSLELLDLEYQEKRQALERIVANKQLTDAVRARAQAELDALPGQQALDRKGVIQATQNPFEQARSDYSDLTDEMQNLKVQGIEAAGSALATLATEGFGSFKEQAISAIRAVIAEFIKMQMIKFLFSMLGSATGAPGAGGGLPSGNPLGFGSWVGGPRARGGPVQAGKMYLVGERGPELAAFGRSGTIIPNHKMGSVLGTGGVQIGNVTLAPGMTRREGRETGLALGRSLHKSMAYSVRGRRG